MTRAFLFRFFLFIFCGFLFSSSAHTFAREVKGHVILRHLPSRDLGSLSPPICFILPLPLPPPPRHILPYSTFLSLFIYLILTFFCRHFFCCIFPRLWEERVDFFTYLNSIRPTLFFFFFHFSRNYLFIIIFSFLFFFSIFFSRFFCVCVCV